MPVVGLCCNPFDSALLQLPSAGALAQVELGQLQIARLGNLQINLRAVDYGDRKPRALDDRGLVGADEAVGLASAKALCRRP